MEPHVLRRRRNAGWIEVICGSMFSGKTEELIRRLKRARIARQRVEIFKPAVDTRFSREDVVSHDANVIQSTSVASATQIILLATDADVIGIDEGQFFDNDLVQVCRELADAGKRVIVAGLDQDYMGHPFEPIPQLMAGAEFVTKLHAICVVCGAPANHSQRLSGGSDRVELGAKDSYEPRCRDCFDPTGEKGIRSPSQASAGDDSIDPAAAAGGGANTSASGPANASSRGSANAASGGPAKASSGGSAGTSSQSVDRLVDSE